MRKVVRGAELVLNVQRSLELPEFSPIVTVAKNVKTVPKTAVIATAWTATAIMLAANPLTNAIGFCANRA